MSPRVAYAAQVVPLLLDSFLQAVFTPAGDLLNSGAGVDPASASASTAALCVNVLDCILTRFSDIFLSQDVELEVRTQLAGN